MMIFFLVFLNFFSNLRMIPCHSFIDDLFLYICLHVCLHVLLQSAQAAIAVGGERSHAKGAASSSSWVGRKPCAGFAGERNYPVPFIVVVVVFIIG